MKISARFLLLALLLFCGTVRAQVAVINPTGGTGPGNDLKITITSGGVEVMQHGQQQFNPAATGRDRGLATYFRFEPQMAMAPYTPVDLEMVACDISEVYGNGNDTAWTVVKLLTLQNSNGAKFHVAVTYRYYLSAAFFEMDYTVSSDEQQLSPDHQLYGPYFLHIYHTEVPFLEGENCGVAFRHMPTTMADDYMAMGFNRYKVIGVTRGAGQCTAAPGTHFVQVSDGAATYYAADAMGRHAFRDFDNFKLKDLLYDVTETTPLNNVGLNVHKALLFSGNNPGYISYNTKRFRVAYTDKSAANFQLLDEVLPQPNDLQPAGKAVVEFSSATPNGPEGDDEHVIDGVTLRVYGSAFNYPQLVTLKVTSTGVTPALPNTDYQVRYYKLVIPAGDYSGAGKHLPLSNIIINGNTSLNGDKTLKIEIDESELACNNMLAAGAVKEAIYTILDDDENKIFFEVPQTTLEEGKQMQVKVYMTGSARVDPTVITVDRETGTGDPAETSDYDPQFPLTLTLAPGEMFKTFTLTATGDRVLESPQEMLHLKASAMLGSQAREHNVSIAILDTTAANANNKVITVTAPPTDEGSTMTITAALPAGVTSEAPLTVALTQNPALTTAASTDYSGFPASIQIPANVGSGTATMNVTTDMVLEVDEYVAFTGELAGFTIDVPQRLVLRDKVPAGASASLTFQNSGNREEGNDVVVTGKLQLSTTVQEATTVTLFVDPASVATLADIEIIDNLTVTIPAGGNIATFTFKTKADAIVEGEETLRFGINLPGYNKTPWSTFKIVDVVGNLIQWDAAPVLIEKGTQKDVTLNLYPGVTATVPIEVQIFDDPISTAGYYTFDPLPLIFAPGETSKTITIQALDAPGMLYLSAVGYVNGVDYPQVEAADYYKEIQLTEPLTGNITLSTTETSLSENDDYKTFTATIDGGVPAATDIFITFGQGGTAGASDVEFNYGPSAVILAGTTSATFEVRGKTDLVLEPTESVQITGTATGYSVSPLNINLLDATGLTSSNKDISLTFPGGTTVQENNSLTVEVHLPSGITVSEETVINLSAGALTELLPIEYTLPTEVRIPAGGSTQSFTVTAANDNILENTERLYIQATGTGLLNGSSTESQVNVTDLTGTIPGNKIITVTPVGPRTVLEGGSITYTFALPTNIIMGYDLDLSFTPEGTNTASPVDFSLGYPGLLTIGEGDNNNTLTLHAESDNLIELQEKMRVKASAPAGFTFSDDILDLDIIDTDLSTSSITLSLDKSSIAENESAEVTATLQGFHSNSDITIALLRKTSSTADAADYDPLGTITVLAGAGSGKATIHSLNDLFLEGNETLVLGGTAGSFNISDVTLTITDATNNQLTVVPDASSVYEGADIKVKVKLPASVTAMQDIQVTIAPGAGTQLGSGEYTISPNPVTIIAGSGEAEFTLAAIDEDVLESDELLELVASATIYGTPVTATANVTVHDAAGNNTITVTGNGDVTEGQTKTITFSLPSGINAGSDIIISLAASGTATAADFEDPLPATITLESGKNSVDLVLRAKADGRIEATENITFAPTATGFTFSGNASANVLDADLASAAIRLTADAPKEEGQQGKLTATLEGVTATDIDIDVTTSKTGGTTTTADHGALPVIRISAGTLSGEGLVDYNTDDLLENDETIIVGGSATGITTVHSTTLTITDKNGQDANNKKITFTPDATSIAEGGNTTIWVRLPAGQKTQDALTVTLSVGAGTSASLLSSEYSALVPVTIPAGGSEASFTLAANTDMLLEGDEALEIVASATVYGSSQTASSTITITDAPGNNAITVTGNGDVTEGQTKTITFSLPSGINAGSDIPIALAASGAATAADFEDPLPATITLESGKNSVDLVLRAKADGRIEATENITFAPTATGFTFSGNASANVLDADLASAAIRLTADAPKEEGQQGKLTATLEGVTATDIDIDVTTSKTGGTTTTADHGALPVIRISAGTLSGEGLVDYNTDDLLENDETIIVGGSATGITTVHSTTLTITDKNGQDANNKKITFTPDATSIAEGGNTTIWVRLPAGQKTQDALTVTLSVGAGTSASLLSSEYSALVPVTIPAGGSEVSFTLTANTDMLLEGDEALEIVASATVYGSSQTASTTVTITDAPGNNVITVAGDAAVTEGHKAVITFSLPAGYTATQDIVIQLHASGSAQAADFATLPATVTIEAGDPSVQLELDALREGVIESAEQLNLNPQATGYTFNAATWQLTVQDDDAATAAITLSAPASVSEGQNFVLTATLSGATASGDIDITLSKTGSTASDADHSTLGTLRIQAGQSTGTLTLTAATDLVLEPAETLVLSGTSNAGIAVTGATVTITDATARSITITPATGTVAEGNAITFTVSLPAGVTTDQKIRVDLTAGATDMDVTEYSFPAFVEIPVSGSAITFDVAAATDNWLEADEHLQVNASADIFGTIAAADVQVTVTDATNTPANKHITVAGPASVNEGQTATFTFSLPGIIRTVAPVVITLQPGVASPAVDAADITGGIPVSVTIPAGAHEVTLDITTNADALLEATEKLFLLPSSTGFTFSNNLMLDVMDINAGGNIIITRAQPDATEGDDVTFTVALPGGITSTADITVNLTKGVSTAADDDHMVLPASVVIPAGLPAVTFTVKVHTDGILETDELLVIEGNSATFPVTGSTLLIHDATGLDPLNKVIQLVPDNTLLNEGQTGHFRVKFPDGISSVVPVTVQLHKTAASSTAADTDHTQIPVSTVIPALANGSALINISAVTDNIIEDEETLRVDGSVPAGFTLQGAVIRIADATGLVPANRRISISIDSTVLHEGNSSNVTFALPANITCSSDIAITVTADGSLSAGPADYTLPAVVIPKDVNSVTIPLQALQDNVDEATEQLRLLGTATGFTVQQSGTLVIPGAAAPAVDVTLFAAMSPTAEPASHGAFILSLAAPAPSDVTVQYTVSGTATAGSDYQALTGTAVIPAGEMNAGIQVTVVDDAIVEGPETVTLTLQSATFSFLGAPVNATVSTQPASLTIGDDDQPQIMIEKTADATEPATAGAVRIRFANTQMTATAPVTVQYSIAGTAQAGVDYDALAGTAVIPAGENGVTVSISPKDDALVEGTETVIVALANATGAIPGITWQLAAQSQTTVNIYDNDVITMEVFGPLQAVEGSALTVTLRASQASSAPVPVKISLQNDAARTVSTPLSRNGNVITVTLPANQTETTFTVTIDDNDINDDNGFVNLVVEPDATGPYPYGKGASGNAATVVTDNDALEITLKQDTARVQEGNSGVTPMNFIVQLSRRSSRAIQLQYQLADAFEGQGAAKDPQRARAGEDFQDNVTAIAIAPMQTEADIVIAVNGDTQEEQDEYFAVKLTAVTVSGGQNVPTIGVRRSAVGVIENDDVDPDTEIHVHKAISPNGDGKNDVLIIENLERYVRNDIAIVNRWGGIVFRTDNYNNASNNFDGTSNVGAGAGKELPDGSYFYILQVWDANGKMTRYNGYIVIKSGL
ncbi:Calx-beta domain-containing protein [Chitinophaga lutea]